MTRDVIHQVITVNGIDDAQQVAGFTGDGSCPISHPRSPRLASDRVVTRSVALGDPTYTLVVVVHAEANSRVHNPFVQSLTGPILRTLITTFTKSLLWKNLLYRICSTQLWQDEQCGKQVAVWRCQGERYW